MKIEVLESMLKKSWTKDTCVASCRDGWSEENPCVGQCAITALIVNDYIGGKIMRCMTSTGSHYFNMIDGIVVDLTKDQFEERVPYEESSERTREYLLSNEDTKNRYFELLKNLKSSFLEYGTKTYTLTNKDGQYESKIPGMFGGNKKLHIYGKMDCYSARRYIKLGKYVQNRVFFEDEKTAIESGYRPCAKCMRPAYLEWKSKTEL